MFLSELEKEVLEKAASVAGTNYDQHNWVTEAEFTEAAEHLVKLKLLDEKTLQINDRKIRTYTLNKASVYK